MIGNSYADMLDESQISIILSTLTRLAEKSLRELKLKGSFVNSGFVSELPTMPHLEGIQFIPLPSRIVEFGRQLLTEVVLDFAKRCPVLLKPRFLRYPHILGSLAISEGPPGGEYGVDPHPDWRLYCQTEYAQ